MQDAKLDMNDQLARLNHKKTSSAAGVEVRECKRGAGGGESDIERGIETDRETDTENRESKQR